MDHGIGLKAIHQPLHRRHVADVAPLEVQSTGLSDLIEIAELLRGWLVVLQVDQDGHGVTFVQKPGDDMGTDESGAAGDEYFQFAKTPFAITSAIRRLACPSPYGL